MPEYLEIEEEIYLSDEAIYNVFAEIEDNSTFDCTAYVLQYA